MALGCIGRIQAYLLTADHRDSRLCSYSDFESFSLTRATSSDADSNKSAASFVVRNGHFGWLAGSPAVLRDVNIHIPSGKLTLLVGPVGCGKTTLLHTLLGETVQIKGQVLILQKSAAFCSQQPWLTNTTIRNTIIGHSPENLNWYEKVAKACALHQDFVNLGEGDQTTIGSGGSSLSGGQKQRVALARALYAKKPVLLLDDIFSGLDRSTEQAIFDALFGTEGLFRTSLAGTTVVFATHAVRYLKCADHIIALLPNGDGASQGTLQDLQSRGALLPDSKYSEQWEKEGRGQQKEPVSGNDPANFTNPANSKTQDQERIFSDKKVLAYYLKSMGFWNLITFISVGVISVGLWKVSDYWARIWSDHSIENPLNPNNSFYVGIYALLNSLALITISFWFAHFLLLVMPKTGVTFHDHILNAVLNAPYPFLSRTDIGSLAARFGQDLLLIDTELPMALVNTLFQIFVLLAQLGLIASASVYLISAFPVLAVAIYIVQRVYLKTSKRIRHLDLEAKAPLYAQFTDTFGGIASIRAFGWQNSSKEENDRVLNNSQRPFYLLFCVQRWLECVLDFMVAALAVIVMGVAVATRSDVGSAQIGVALLNLVTLGENLKSLVKFWTMLETTITAVARIQGFVYTTPQEPKPLLLHEEKTPDSSDMSITLNNVSASYLPDGPKVLSSLTLHIAAGERIAVCGRSGSGKSSFLSTLLKMIEISDGELIICGRPSTSFGNQELRQRLNTIPQDPYFYPGTLRQNLDPDTSSTDADITAVLAKVGLADKIADLGGLDAELAIETFSAGQLQLLSLGRAMIKPRGIVLLDEATSNVDNDTDRKMHDIIFEHFTGQTVVAILHRREHLHRFDCVALIHEGRLVSIGKPSEVNLDM